MEIKKIEKVVEEKKESTEFFVGEQPTDIQRVIAKDGKVIDILELLVDIANKVERAGLK